MTNNQTTIELIGQNLKNLELGLIAATNFESPHNKMFEGILTELKTINLIMLRLATEKKDK